jgi:hypothetical protein
VAENGDEKAMGPLFIQGDHGQWPSAASGTKTTPPPRDAGRHQVRLLPRASSTSAQPAIAESRKEGNLPELTWSVVPNPEDRFIVRLTGTMKIVDAGPYLFTAEGGGAVNLTVAGKPVVEQYSKRGPNAGTVELAAGDQPFEIVYYKP